MEEIIPRDVILNGTDPNQDWMRNMLLLEAHHDHVIIRDGRGTLRWRKKESVSELISPSRLNLNDLYVLLHSLGYGKNSEIFRHMYRCMGYSLYGYWEIFHWEVNNDIAHEYVPNKIP